MLISRIGAAFVLIAAAALLPFSARALVNAGALPITKINDLEIADGLACITRNAYPDGSPNLLILDLSEPAAPVEIGSIPRGWEIDV